MGHDDDENFASHGEINIVRSMRYSSGPCYDANEIGLEMETMQQDIFCTTIHYIDRSQINMAKRAILEVDAYDQHLAKILLMLL